jgi:mRNA-degrading endonuclease RelE of RelBE toxin-antitoxin system
MLKAIAEDPHGPGTKPLTNVGRFRAARVGGWRIVYLVDEAKREVRVEVIGTRGQAYRRL